MLFVFDIVVIHLIPQNTNWRARDDLDMEVTLRPRINAPDVVRSALGHKEKISENSIDRLFAAPNKIVIPERYIPEQVNVLGIRYLYMNKMKTFYRFSPLRCRPKKKSVAKKKSR